MRWDVLRGLGNWNECGIEIVAEASDGEYGLELISRLQPNIIVTDVKMPHMDGLELLETLRRRGSQAKVRAMNRNEVVVSADENLCLYPQRNEASGNGLFAETGQG